MSKVRVEPNYFKWAVFLVVALLIITIWIGYVMPFFKKGEVIPTMIPQPTETKTEVALGTLPISWQVNSIWSYDESDVDSWGTMKVYYGDWKFLGTLTDDTATSLTLPAGIRKVKLVIDYGSNNIGFIDKEKTLNQPYFENSGVYDVDNDGTEELYFDVDFSQAGELRAGESQKSITSNLFLIKVDTTLAITKTVDASGCNVAGDKYAEGYVSNWDGMGYGFKLVYLKVTLPDSGNASYADPSNSYFVLKDIVIGGKKFSDVGSFDVANRQWVISVPNVKETSEPEQGILFYYDRNLGATWCNIIIHAYTKFPTTGVKITPTLVITAVKPDGTTYTISATFIFSS
jgi:hypothetical protein